MSCWKTTARRAPIPSLSIGVLRKHSEVLRRMGLIDGGELIELNELADARYADAAESLLSRQESGG